MPKNELEYFIQVNFNIKRELKDHKDDYRSTTFCLDYKKAKNKLLKIFTKKLHELREDSVIFSSNYFTSQHSLIPIQFVDYEKLIPIAESYLQKIHDLKEGEEVDCVFENSEQHFYITRHDNKQKVFKDLDDDDDDEIMF